MHKPDDLAGLALQTGLDPSGYKIFLNERARFSHRKDESAAKPSTTEDKIVVPTRVKGEDETCRVKTGSAAIRMRESNSPPPNRETGFQSDSLAQTALPLTSLVQFSRWERWTGLDVVLAGASHNQTSKQFDAHAFDIPAVSICGVAGGVGITTIAASLARICAQRGEQAVLLDISHDSLLPLFFGGRSSTVPISSFVFSGDPKRGAVHTCRRDEKRESAEGWVTRCLDALVGASDQLIIDAGVSRICEVSNRRIGEMTRIVTLVPDTRCLASLKRIEDSTGELSANETTGPLLLLNQFDPSDSLHVEISARLGSRFPHRLIPIAVRRDRQVAAALAEGMTIIDYAPESVAAEDLARLEHWLRGGRSAAQRAHSGSFCANTLDAPFSDSDQKVQVL